ncbi:MAG: hypothetical protein KDB23_24265 [Planctomycetales bacterium]|nr:hypothetical protein [Planctomycetales bacterium]
MNVNLWQIVDTYLRSNNVDGAAADLESRLRAAATDRFVSLADSHFTNSPLDVLSHINKFVTACQFTFDVRAVYLEMNGFDINYDRWYFDSFAYTEYSDEPDDLDWLCEWNSPDWDQVTLDGLEETQEDFRWYMENKIYEKKTHDKEKEIATLLVMIRFVQLIQSTLDVGSLQCPIPLLATAHDFDMFGRFVPKNAG